MCMRAFAENPGFLEIQEAIEYSGRSITLWKFLIVQYHVQYHVHTHGFHAFNLVQFGTLAFETIV